MKDDRRQYPRSMVNWLATIKTPQRIMVGKLKDVSSAGAFVFCDKPLTPYRHFYLSIHVHPGVASFTSMAEAIRFTHNGMGVRFHPDRPEEFQLLSTFITDA